jgi:hypothetical protein
MFECPTDYVCELNAYYGRYQCCQPITEPAPTVEACPTGMSPQIHPTSGKPILCDGENISWTSNCARFAKCEYSASYGKHICCEPNDLQTLLKITEGSPLIFSGLHPGDKCSLEILILLF